MQQKEASKIVSIVSDETPDHGCDGEMPTRLIKSQASPLLRIALLILAAAVFAWGLQYKLSLYQSASYSHPISVAKLIQGERTNKEIASTQVRIRDSSSQFSLDSNLPTFRPPIIVRRNRQVDKLVYPSIMFVPCFLFFRPPPQAS